MDNSAVTDVAVLVSGGLDSSVLAVHLSDSNYHVYPIYIQHGLYWEATERDHLTRFLCAVARPNIAELKILELPVTDMYESHWSVSGNNVPDENTQDDAVFLPGRNLLLLAKASVWCSLTGIRTIALAPLSGNPFADNSNAFYRAIEQSIQISSGQNMDIIRPFSNMSKDQVLQLGGKLPLHLTFSCIRPHKGLHCGRCNKCAERKLAYHRLGIEDATPYAT
ncbi:7-cyano-7-deazaguanine synthase [Arenicella xantha]|uniref:7-cyano-7-deazaguanine synthase n=1 Tax=Arenicella xantha TaxID=644221 RepID=A0A395JTG5_9GAMM|nr:7-cyano-7-deazaguanine synthase [Arenicella xantha]RBP52868.1 7-cyano-7-deazaguanine synthase [Arenicella xantha]